MNCKCIKFFFKYADDSVSYIFYFSVDFRFCINHSELIIDDLLLNFSDRNKPDKMALKWGIASAGRIAHDFVNAVGTLSQNEHQVVAVGARDLSRAQEFANRFGIPKAHGSYLELAKDPNVEAVHIGTYDIDHMEIALLMLEHGKHVLVEKPMGMNEKQVRKITTLAKQKNLFAMEGIWSRMFPCYEYICKQIDSGKLGDIVSVQVDFGAEGLKNDPRFT